MLYMTNLKQIYTSRRIDLFSHLLYKHQSKRWLISPLFHFFLNPGSVYLSHTFLFYMKQNDDFSTNAHLLSVNNSHMLIV